MSITDIGANAAEESSADNNAGDVTNYERFDLDGISFGRQHPTTAVRGTAVALRKLYDENDPDRSDVAVILDNPTVVTDDESLDGSVVVQSEEEGDQFKVVNTDDDQTRVLDGMGVDFAGNTFYGDIEGFDGMDRIALKRGGGAGTRIAKTLDADGATAAEATVERDEDGELTDLTLDEEEGFPAHNGGYIEYDNEGDQLPRQSRDPELRPDVEGQEVVVMIQRLSEIDPEYDGPSYWATVFANLDDDRQTELTERYASESDRDAESFSTEIEGTEFLQLAPTSEFDVSDELLEDTGWIDWTGIDRSNEDEVLRLNEARLDEGFGSVYIPEGASPQNVVPESAQDDLVLDPGEGDWGDESDVTPAFGAGATAPESSA